MSTHISKRAPKTVNKKKGSCFICDTTLALSQLQHQELKRRYAGLLLSTNRLTLVINFQPMDDEIEPPRTESHLTVKSCFSNRQTVGVGLLAPLVDAFKACRNL